MDATAPRSPDPASVVALAWALLDAGRLRQAAESASQLLAADRRSIAPPLRAEAAAVRAIVAAWTTAPGHEEAMREVMTGFDPYELQHLSVRLHRTRGMAAAAAGDHEGAWRHLRKSWADDGTPVHYLLSDLAIGDLAMAAVRTGRQEEATSLLRGAAHWAGRGCSTRRRLILHRARALLGAPGEAEHSFRLALVNAAGEQWPVERALARLDYAEWLRRQRRPSDARPQLTAAAAALAESGPRLWSSRASAELEAATAPRPSRDDAYCARLTVRQRAVADLAAQGHSNRQIADQLFLSVRTVTTHLSRVFTCLGVTRRAQLARALRELDGRDPSSRPGLLARLACGRRGAGESAVKVRTTLTTGTRRLTVEVTCNALEEQWLTPAPVLEPAAQKFCDDTARPPHLFGLSIAVGRKKVQSVQSGDIPRPAVTISELRVPGGPSGTVPVRIITPAAARPAAGHRLHPRRGLGLRQRAHPRPADPRTRRRRRPAWSSRTTAFTRGHTPPRSRSPTPSPPGSRARRRARPRPDPHRHRRRLRRRQHDRRAHPAGQAARRRLLRQQVLHYPAPTPASTPTPTTSSPRATSCAATHAVVLGPVHPRPAQRARSPHPRCAPRWTSCRAAARPRITAEADVLRDEGEAYAARLRAAGVPVTAARYQGIIHDFVMLDALRDTHAATAATAQGGQFPRRPPLTHHTNRSFP